MQNVTKYTCPQTLSQIEWKLWSCIRVKTVRKSFYANSRSDLMTYVLIDAFVMLALLLISSQPTRLWSSLQLHKLIEQQSHFNSATLVLL